MLSALLRSGDIKDYTALGQDGMAVYAVASQLRDAIKFKRGRTFSEYLAIPQRNDQGSQIDWYIPFESDKPDGQYMIVPWTSATDEEREKAWAELHIFERTMLELGNEMIATPSTKGDQLLFARLLCGGNSKQLDDIDNLKALRFPNPEHVYLVNDRPVITFWGFTEKNIAISGAPFLSLKPIVPASPITPVAPVAPIVAEAVEAPVKRNWSRHLCCILPLLFLLLGLLFWYFKGLWWPTLNLPGLPIFSTEQSEVVSNEKSANEKIVPRECEIRKISGHYYYFIGGHWLDETGKVVSDNALLDNLALTTPEAETQCAEMPAAIKQSGYFTAVPGVGTVANGNLAGMTPNNALPTQENAATPPELASDNQALAPAAAEGEVKGEENLANTPENPLVPPELDQDADPQAGSSQENAANNPLDPNNPLASNNPVAPNNPLANGQNGSALDPSQQANGQASAGAKPLTIPPASQQNGKLDFLNGQWNAGAGIQDKTTGKPLRLSYKFNNGKGQVELQRGDGVKCVGNIAAQMNGGKLSINNAGVAKCSDGSSYQLPNVSCKAGVRSSADCQGQYQNGQQFPMTIKSN